MFLIHIRHQSLILNFGTMDDQMHIELKCYNIFLFIYTNFVDRQKAIK